MQERDVLILGAGWTATFLIPLLKKQDYSFAATTTDGRKVADSETIKFKFDADADDAEKSIGHLPLAKNVLITFPLTSAKQVEFLVNTYSKTHKRQTDDIHFIQLGSTGIWQIDQKTLWVSRCSPYDTKNARAIAEDELIKLGGTSLNLAGLWGGERKVQNFVDRIIKTKEDVKSRTSLHMIHGLDVSRAILAVIDQWDTAKGQRWMLTDGFVYDWYALLLGWADLSKDGSAAEEPSKQAQWVLELMDEEQVWALPRSANTLGRCYYGREFWTTFELTPLKSRL